ncbi:RHS repeat-associated core domain-containing protein [Tatumella morbirosei]|uniref:RHS repeat-associated core domain-containing protein n=1 Tax=Tatumella morbirosei TaxID=642227 RepID=UPI00069BEAAF|nr:RHS repeat-associated core domain-containing protein [Tatumella morbirosei]
MTVTNSDFYSQASNFISSVGGGVDPRTGLFNVTFPLINLHSGSLAGPILSLSLLYSPLSDVNHGFGSGFSLNLSSCDTNTGKLQLSSGEEYRVNIKTLAVKQKKLKNFILNKTDDTHFQIIHKSGLKEVLSLRKDVYVPSQIIAPDGRTLTFTWDSGYTPVRLSRVTDGEGSVLLSVSYPDGSVASTKFTLLPDDIEAGYNMIFRFKDEHLISVTSQSVDPALVWTFDYDDVGPRSSYRALTGLTFPTGKKEKVSYYSDSGMAFPESAGLPDLPCVHRHTVTPGKGQPQTVTLWSWTQYNYLGKDAGLNQWQPDTDQMLNILLIGYIYGSTAKVMDTDGSTVLNTVTRRYNSYHLLVSETTLRHDKTFSTTVEYHARPGVNFEVQPEQYALPAVQTESWSDDSGAAPRTRVTLTQFDESGNPLHQETPEGTVMEYVYYPAEGEGDACPADPDGFVRWLKSKTVTPPQIKGDEPVSVTVTTWKKLSTANGDGYNLVSDKEVQKTGGTQSVVVRDYYSDSGDMLTYAREKSQTTTLVPDIIRADSFTSRRDFTYQTTGQGLIQTETFTGHDNVTLTRSTLSHKHTGLVLSETDAQNVTLTNTYDNIGRPLTRTIARGTPYENVCCWTYALEKGGPVTVTTDQNGNQLKIYLDGLGREISREILDKDDTQQWFEMASRTYTPLGEVGSSISHDWLPGSSEQFSVDATASYDGWGRVSQRAFSDGTRDLQQTDLVALRNSTYSQGRAGNDYLSSGKTTTTYDVQSLVPLIEERTDTSGQPVGVRYYAWDGLGRLRLETDERNNETERTYDEYGRVLTLTLPDGSRVTRCYAPHLTNDSVASISVTGPDAYGQTRTWLLGTRTFDSLGRVTELNCGGRTTTYTYEGASPAPSLVTLPSSNILEYKYIPELGNVVSSLKVNGIMQAFSYDAVTGDLLTAKEGSTEDHQSWNPSGSLANETFSRDGEKRQAGYTYTLAGELTGCNDICAAQTTSGRDIYGRVITLTDDALIVGLEYDELSRLSVQTVTDSATQVSMTTGLHYDDFDREVSRTITDNSGVTLTLKQTWLPNNLISSRTTQRDGSTIKQERFNYDVRNRLIEYAVTGDALPEDGYGHRMTAQTYQYDALNKLTVIITTLEDGSIDTATYLYENVNDPTQLTSVIHTHTDYPQTITLKYDTDGRMTQDEAGRLLDYDVIGRLISVSGDNISGGRYGYDALNRLVSQNVTDGDTRQLYYQSNELVNEVLVEKNKATRLIKNGHTCLGVSDGSRLTLTGGDQNNSLLWSRNGDGQEAQQHNWSPYGSGDATELLPGYNGERTDPVSGTYHLGNGYRAYNPVLMRFNCPDSLSPFGAGGINPYAYCSGDPVNYTDPTGHISWQGILGIITGALGLAFSVFTAGASIAAAGGVMAAMGAASATSLVVGGLSVVADVTGIASGAVEESNPQASSILGWVAMATGLAGLGAGVRQGVSSAAGRARSASGDMQSWTTTELDQSISRSGNTIYRMGYTDNWRGLKEEGLLLHGGKTPCFSIGGKVRENIDEMERFFFGLSYSVEPQIIHPSELNGILKQNYGIDLSIGKTPLHLNSCYAKRGAAQLLADDIGRPVIAYSKHGTTNKGIGIEGIEKPSFLVKALYRKHDIRLLLTGRWKHNPSPRIYYPQDSALASRTGERWKLTSW